MIAPCELRTDAGSNVEESELANIYKWLSLLYLAYCERSSSGIETNLAGCLNSMNAASNSAYLDENSCLYNDEEMHDGGLCCRDKSFIWHLVKFCHTNDRAHLTSYFRHVDVSQLSGSVLNELDEDGGTQHVVEGLLQCSRPEELQALPLWCLYALVAEEMRRNKLYLEAALASYRMAESFLALQEALRPADALVSGPDDGRGDDVIESDPRALMDEYLSEAYPWWPVLRAHVKMPENEAAAMTSVLQALVEENFLQESYKVVLEAVRVRAGEDHEACCNVALIDMVLDVDFLRLVEVVQSFERKLRVAQLSGATLTRAEQEFRSLCGLHDVARVHGGLQWVADLVEVRLAGGWRAAAASLSAPAAVSPILKASPAPTTAPPATVSGRALANVHSGQALAAAEFRARAPPI